VCGQTLGIVSYGQVGRELVSSQKVEATPCGCPLGQAQDLPLPQDIEKIRELARLAKAFKRIIALKRDPEQRRLLGYQWQGVGDLDGILPERFLEPDELHTLLRESDFVVNCLPHTSETRNMFGERYYSAYCSRGMTIPSLVAWKRSGKASGLSSRGSG
jgi:hypothetical protein